MHTQPCREQHRALLVVSSKYFPATTGSVPKCVQVRERMQIDRFLVLQYEGGLHTLSRLYETIFCVRRTQPLLEQLRKAVYCRLIA
jgi:hypothetical protein